MKVAFLSDVHGNEVAIEACLAAARRLNIDTIHFLGDAVGYLPGELPVLQRLEDERIACQRGNHEAMLLADTLVGETRETLYRLAPARARLRDTPRWGQIQSWPTRVERQFGGRRFLLVHGSPSDEIFGYVHEDTDLAPFSGLPAEVIVMANTHRPWIREIQGRLFVNTGSVGLPRDHGALAAFAVYDTDTGALGIVRVRIDVAEIARRYGNDIAPEIAKCFARRAEQPVGEIVA
jgi:putative phosphoesterase